jgi:selenocysteine-specific elongation factor
MDIIVGTAGHIDHGKTALVRALTGTDADRLPEEKQRGITIDIGFAELEADGVHLGFVDVPGHERFVKNMLAGASGIDVVLLVIAADEGVMPQTREHFEICRLLGLSRGIVVLTKIDQADDETRELARIDAAELVAGSFLADAPVAEVSSLTGEGIDQLKAELARIAHGVPARSGGRVAFLPIDRSFTVKGFGAVVTGTLASGEIAEGAELDLLPADRRVRVRGVQTHGRSVKMAHAGQRTAINLGGIDHSEIERGMVLAEPGVLRPMQIFDAEEEMLADASRPLRSRQRVRVHVGTAEILARVFVLNDTGEIAAGGRGYVQFRLESPVTCVMGDRFIVRSYSPQRTIGGGRVVVPLAGKHKKRDIPEAAGYIAALLAAGENRPEIVRLMAEAAGKEGAKYEDVSAATGWQTGVLRDAIGQNVVSGSIVDAGGILLTATALDRLCSASVAAIDEHHCREPLSGGMPREALREKLFKYLANEVFAAAISKLESDGKIVVERDLVRSAEHTMELSPAEMALADRIRDGFRAYGSAPPKLDEALAQVSAAGSATADTRKLFQMLLRKGEVVKVTNEFYFSAEVIDELRSAVRRFADGSADRLIDVAAFKEIAGVSRKYAIPLLEYFDRERLTVRVGDKRMVLK